MKFGKYPNNRRDWHGSLQNVCRGTHHWGGRNLWDNMTKAMQKTRMSAGKDIQLNRGIEVLTLKATTSPFARLLVIARSSRECRSGRSDRECETMTSASTKEEAGTLMNHHAVEVASDGMNVNIYPQRTRIGYAIFGSTKKTTS